MPTEAKVTVTVAKTADGQNDYLQVMSGDLSSLNFVIIAKEILLKDVRVETAAAAAAAATAPGTV